MLRSQPRRGAGRASIGCHRDEPAFTLIELLVTIAVIALLAAVLLPTLAAVRTRAAAAVSVANARSLAQVMLVSIDDERGEMPRSTHSFFAFQAEGARPWYRTAFEYATGDGYRQGDSAFHAYIDKALRSPLDPRVSGEDMSPFAPEYNGSYAINVYIELSDAETPDGMIWRRLDRVPAHSSTVFFAESAEGEPSGGALTRGRDHVMAHFWRLGAPPHDEIAVDRNKPGSAYAFLDGHAKNERLEAVWRPGEDGSADQPAIDRFNPSTAR